MMMKMMEEKDKRDKERWQNEARRRGCDKIVKIRRDCDEVEDVKV